MSHGFGLSGLDEVRAYLADPVLGPRLVECVEVISANRGRAAADILGDLDAMKHRSSLTLFEGADGGESVFAKGRHLHFAGVHGVSQQTARPWHRLDPAPAACALRALGNFAITLARRSRI